MEELIRFFEKEPIEEITDKLHSYNVEFIDKKEGDLMESKLIFEGIPSGDYEEVCFAVTPKTYELVTGCKPKLMKDLYKKWGFEGEPKNTYLDENPFNVGMVNLYLHEIKESENFSKHLGRLSNLLYSGKEELVRIEFD